LANVLPDYRREILAPAAQGLRLLLDQAIQKPLEAWDQAVVAPLLRIPPQEHHLLVVDALDVALAHRPAVGEPGRVTIVDLLAHQQTLPPWLKIFASSRNNERVIDRLTEDRDFHKLEVGFNNKNNLDDLYNYVETRCQASAFTRKLKEARLNPSELAHRLTIDSQSGGKFLYVESMLHAIEKDRIQLSNLDSLPQGMKGFYQLTFESLFSVKDESYEPVRRLLGLLCEQREPLGLSELSEIVESTKNQVKKWLEPLHSLLRHRKETRTDHDAKTSVDTFYSFDHISFLQWLRDEDEGGLPFAGDYQVNIIHAQELFCRWALNTMMQCGSGDRSYSRYLVCHLKSHLKLEEQEGIMAGLQTDLKWLNARLDYQDIHVLLNDFPDISQSLDMENVKTQLIVSRALRQSAQILHSHKGQLAAQLLARLQVNSEDLPAKVVELCQQAREFAHKHSTALPLVPSLANPYLSRYISLPILKLNDDNDLSLIDSSVAMSFSSQLIMFALKGQLWTWNLKTGIFEEVQHFTQDIMTPDKSLVGAICPYNEDLAALSFSDDHSIILWKFDQTSSEAKNQRRLNGHTALVHALLFIKLQINDKEMKLLISASADQTIRIWDINIERPLYVFDIPNENRAHKDYTQSIAYLGEGYVVAGSSTGILYLWNILKGSNPIDVQNCNPIIGLAVNHSQSCLYALTHMGQDLGNNLVEYRRKLDELMIVDEVSELAVPADVHMFCSSVNDTLCFVRNGDTVIYCRQELINSTDSFVLGQHVSPIHCLAASQDVNQIASASFHATPDGYLATTISIWDCPYDYFAKPAILQAHPAPVYAIRMMRRDSILSISSDSTIYIWDLSNRNSPKQQRSENLEATPFTELFLFDQTTLALRSESRLLLYTIVNPTIISSLDYFQEYIDILRYVRDAYGGSVLPQALVKSRKDGLIVGFTDGRVICKRSVGAELKYTTYSLVGNIKIMVEMSKQNLFCLTDSFSKEEDFTFWICDLKKSEEEIIDDKGIPAIIAAPVFSIAVTPERVYHSREDVSSATSIELLKPPDKHDLRLLKVWDRFIAFAHSDYLVSIWQLEGIESRKPQLNLIYILQGHTACVTDIIDLADVFITSSEDKTIRSWPKECSKKNGYFRPDANLFFVGDYSFTCLCHYTKKSIDSTDLIIVGDQMGILHWLERRTDR
jgi:WD40 repeat protein